MTEQRVEPSMQPGRIVLGWAAFFAAMLALAAWSSPAAAQDAAEVAEIYSNQCAPCHGVAGEGAVGPNLVDSVLTPAEQESLVADGTDLMPAFGDILLAEDIEALVVYAATLDEQPEEEEVEAQEEEPGRSAIDVYSQGCEACHGVGASGGPGGPSLLETALSTDELAAVIAGGGVAMPAFEQVYTPGEIEAVSEYILDLGGAPTPATDPVAAGAELFAAQCAACHGADAAGGAGPSLLTSSLSSEELSSFITSGGPTMPAFETLGADEVGSLVAYVEATAGTEATGTTESSDMTLSLSDGTAGTDGAAETTDPTGTGPPPLLAGQVVFAENCGLCHGAEGAGGSASSLRGIDLTGNEIITRVYGGHSAGMPAFRQTLTSAEVQEVALYVLTLPEPTSEGLSRRTIGIGAVSALVLAGVVYVAWRLRPRRHRPATG